MRVTGSMISNQIVENLNIDLERLQEAHQQVSTGRRINRPSDDPLGTQRVVNLQEAMAGIDQYQRNAKYVLNWTSASEGILNNVTNTLSRAHTLAVRAANDATLSQTELNDIADEVNSLLEKAYQLGNSTQEGKFLFSGFQTSTPAFSAVYAGGEITAVNYAGDNGADQVEIDQGQVVNKNVPGSQVFQPAAGTDVFASLIALRDALRAGDHAGILAGVDATEDGRQQVTEQIGLLGNKTNLLEFTQENLGEKKTGLVKLTSELADVDMPEAIVRLQTAQNIYTAALQSSAKIMEQPSLMDFLQ